MAQAVEAAIIAGSASITVGLIAAYASAWQGKRTRELQQQLADEQRSSEEKLAETQHDLDKALSEFNVQLERRARAEQQALDAREAFTRVHVPLRNAADDLGHRINNLRTQGFLAYVTEENQRTETAVLGTAYRFARFFATLEMLYDRAEHLRLAVEQRDAPSMAGDATSDSMLRTLTEIGITFATDRYDRRDGGDFRSSQFMIWREEQRAMGEIAWDRDRDAVVGFATFATRATGPNATWFRNLVTDLEAGSAPTSKRLELIESLLARLVRLLDSDRSHAIEDEKRENVDPAWMRRARPDPD